MTGSCKISAHLETEINQLGALLNKLASADGQKGKNGRKGAAGAFSAKTRSGYRSITEEVIDLLARVRQGQQEN